MENKYFRIKLGQWKKQNLSEDHIIYQCSECGNIDEPNKEICSCCKAKMLKPE